MSRKAVSKLTMVLLLTIMITYVNATEVESVTVEPGRKEILFFVLEEGERFKGSLAIVDGNDIDFYMWGPPPNYETVVDLGRVNQGASFEFIAKESGDYIFNFANRFSSERKIIELSYDIYRPPLIDFTRFLLIIVGLLIIIIIIVLWRM